MNASSEEVAAWIENQSHNSRLIESQEATSSGNNSGASLLTKGRLLMSCTKKEKYSFICESFFMTTRVLNLGLMKALSDFKHLVQVWMQSPCFSSVCLYSCIKSSYIDDVYVLWLWSPISFHAFYYLRSTHYNGWDFKSWRSTYYCYLLIRWWYLLANIILANQYWCYRVLELDYIYYLLIRLLPFDLLHK